MNSASDDIWKLYCVLSAREWGGGWQGRGASVNNKIPAGKMAAINRVQYHPPPPPSFCEGLRILKKLRDIVVQIVDLPL
jgi:hypothetical protein